MAWTEQEQQITLKLVEENKLYKDIQKALAKEGFDKSTEAIRSFIRRNRKEKRINIERPAVQSSVPHTYKEAIEKIEKLREQLVKATISKFSCIGRPKLKATTKVLSLSDFHVPFDNSEVIEHALANHNDADILVVNGDLLELYAVSKWPKYKDIMLQWEYHIAFEWVKLFSEVFKEVYLVLGNHEHRLKSYFSSTIDPVVSFLVDDDILSKLSEGYDFEGDKLVKKHAFNNVHYQSGLLNWYTKIGKCIFAHPRMFSSIPMRTGIKAAEYFTGKEDFQAIVIGHTHKLGEIIWRDKLIIEQGCCCVPMDYEADGKLKYLPQAFGYAVVYMDKEGNVDFDKSKTVYRGTGFPVKPEL